VADESDKSQAIRLVFQPKSSRQTQDELMNVLLAHTSLESSVPINMTMIGLDGRPQQKPLSKIIREWVEFRLSTVRRRSEHRLAQVDDRLHILGRPHGGVPQPRRSDRIDPRIGRSQGRVDRALRTLRSPGRRHT